MQRKIRNALWGALRAATGRTIYEKLRAYHNLKYWLELDNPSTYCEKIVRMKLNDDPRFCRLSDKIEVRDYVAEKVGETYLTKLYATTHDPNAVDWASLPPSFVVKASHSGGSQGVMIVHDKTTEDVELLVKSCKSALAEKFGYWTNESWYRRIKPRLLIEELLNCGNGEIPLDFKFHCFNGKCNFIQVDVGRFTRHTRAFYSPDWEIQDFTFNYPQATPTPAPHNLTEMIEIAEKLADGFGFVRVDLYSLPTRVVFGEMTFAPESGWCKFQPKEWDKKLGRLLV